MPQGRGSHQGVDILGGGWSLQATLEPAYHTPLLNTLQWAPIDLRRCVTYLALRQEPCPPWPALSSAHTSHTDSPGSVKGCLHGLCTVGTIQSHRKNISLSLGSNDHLWDYFNPTLLNDGKCSFFLWKVNKMNFKCLVNLKRCTKFPL